MTQNYQFKYQSSKKTQEAINRFKYYQQQVLPSYCDGKSKFEQNCVGKLEIHRGSKQIFYFSYCDLLRLDSVFDQNTIMRSIKALHFEGEEENIVKINTKSFRKFSHLKGSLLISGVNIEEIIEVKMEKNIKDELVVYIVHHCQIENQKNCLKWLNFVEKYCFKSNQLSYQLICSFKNESSIFSFSSSNSKLQEFIKNHFVIQKLQGLLLRHQQKRNQKKKQSEDPAFAQNHRITNKIPAQFLRGYYELKKKFPNALEKDICRFYVASNFNYQTAKSNISNYFDWKKDIQQKYKWEDFEEFHKRKIFTYLGEDHEGRPVILYIAENLDVENMDHDKYCVYYMYFMEIYLPTKMRGHIYQISIIADLLNIGSKSFNLSIFRRNLAEGALYCAQRQYQCFTIHVNKFAYFSWNIIKPVIPKKAADKIFVGASNEQQILTNLQKDMSLKTVPKYLGGKNQII